MPTARLLSDRPTVRFRPDGRRVLREELVVDLGHHYPRLHAWARGTPHRRHVLRSWQGHTVLRVPPGFVYDGASLPWWTLPVLGAKERWEAAGAAHDALYRWGAPRDVSDAVFWRIARSGARSARLGAARGWLAWAGLRVGGWVAYRARSREREAM